MIFLVRNGPSGHLRAGPVDVTAKGGEKGPGAISPLVSIEGGGVYPSCKDGSALERPPCMQAGYVFICVPRARVRAKQCRGGLAQI